ncbi:hypothetical protein ZIOFF_006358 [Zingiber officinale]|uniref:GTP cyclohydrolase 1 n=1 Tax=Zingiber officinale TaxID=94328 RepID=A0A8J5LVK8_ZINOF|nr:hypothetical protein ZIOFF_006358 [Zingiber officinale]
MKTTRGKGDIKFRSSKFHRCPLSSLSLSIKFQVFDLHFFEDLDISSRRRPEKRSPTLAAAAAAKADEEEGEQIWGEEEEATNPLALEAERALSIEEDVKALLQGLGEVHEREGLRRTPHRVAEAFRGGTRGLENITTRFRYLPSLSQYPLFGYKQKAKDIVQGALFPEAGLNPGVGHAGGVGGLVVVRDINLFSYCESCLLPFSIKCHVGYVPSGGHVVGLSKLSRVADVFARRFQDPKRLASEVCAALHNSINPASVAVSLQCWHMKFSHLCDTNFTHSTISDMQSWGTVLASSRIISASVGRHKISELNQRQVVRKEERLLISAEMAIDNPSATIQVTRPSQSSFSSSSENMTPLHVSAANVNGDGYDIDKDGSSPEGHVTEPAMETVALQVRKFPPPDVSHFNITQGKDFPPGNVCGRRDKNNQVSRLNNNGAMVKEGGKFGCDISHVNNYTTVAERSMDRFAVLMSSFRYTQSSARASVLRAPLKDVQNSSSSARRKAFTNLKYSRVEIDEVRFQWAECMLDYI